jgi:putative ABC transport system permease protein
MSAKPDILVTRWMILGEWRAHPGRVVTAAIAIAIGVALGLAVHLVNASALSEFSKAVNTVNGEAQLQVRSTTSFGFDEGVYPTVSRLAGVAAVSPVIELEAGADRPGETLTVLGLDVFRAAVVTPSLVARPLTEAGERRGPTPTALLDQDAVFLSDAALQERKVGDQIELAVGDRRASFRIAGALPGVGEGRQLAVLDIATAPVAPGPSGPPAAPGLAACPRRGPRPGDGRCPQRAAAGRPGRESADTQARRSDALSRAYRVNLNMLALMALLTGGFLVYSAQSLSVARRRSQFALLRVLGVRRRGLLRQVLVEGLSVGLVGGLAGVALGVGLAVAALRVLGGDLGGGYFDDARPELVVDPAAAVLFFALGVLTALVGSLVPAREAADAQPAVALKNLGDRIDPRRVPPVWPALALLLAGGLAAFAPAVWEIPLFGYLSMALLLAGGIAATPRLARLLLGPLRRRATGLVGPDLAIKRLWGAPSQAAVALCGVVASTSLMVAMAVMVSSFRGSVEEWLDQVLPADLYLRVEAAGPEGGFRPEDQAALASVTGVGGIYFMRTASLQVAPDKPPVALIARPDGGQGEGAPPMIGKTSPPPPGTIPVYVSEPASWLYGWRTGQRIELPLGEPRAGAAPRFFVAGVWRDYARQHGAVTLDSRDYTRLTGDAARGEASVVLQPGVTPAAAEEALRQALKPDLAARVSVAQPRALRDLALRIFDRSFAVTYGLEGIAILVGLAGVAATVSAQTLARTKEFGMLRHLGVTRRQILSMLATEGVLLGLIGGVAGLTLGLVMGQVLIHVVNPQSFHWTMETRLPILLLASIVAALIASAAVTALAAGRRAVSSDAVRAVREDW